MYEEVWEASFGEVLTCERESDDASDRYAVAIKKDGNLIMMVARNQSCWLVKEPHECC